MKMWHEARRQEKKLRGMMVDYRKRAERRRAFYERMKQDPTQFLRVYGQKYKIHIDPQLSSAGDGKTVMMPWQGDSNNMIDRFDVRAHLDIIPEQPSSSSIGALMETDPEENRLNYERYRTLVMIDYSGASEESYLRQLEIEEMYGAKKADEKKDKEKSQAKATIGFTYDNSKSVGDSDKDDDDDNDDDSDSDSDSILSDIDVTVDVDEIDTNQRETLDSRGLHYGMASAQFCRKLKEDKEELEEQRRLRQQEEERSLVTGRRARRERRSLRERQRRKAHDVELSPPSYARKASPTYEPYRRSSSRSSSRSPSPENAGKVEFITEFSHSSTDQPSTKASGDSRSRSSSSRSVCLTLLSAR